MATLHELGFQDHQHLLCVPCCARTSGCWVAAHLAVQHAALEAMWFCLSCSDRCMFWCHTLATDPNPNGVRV